MILTAQNLKKRHNHYRQLEDQEFALNILKDDLKSKYVLRFYGDFYSSVLEPLEKLLLKEFNTIQEAKETADTELKRFGFILQ